MTSNKLEVHVELWRQPESGANRSDDVTGLDTQCRTVSINIAQEATLTRGWEKGCKRSKERR